VLEASILVDEEMGDLVPHPGRKVDLASCAFLLHPEPWCLRLDFHPDGVDRTIAFAVCSLLKSETNATAAVGDYQRPDADFTVCGFEARRVGKIDDELFGLARVHAT